MEVVEAARGAGHDLQPRPPGQRRVGSAEEVVVQGLVGHELVHQQPVLAGLRVHRAVAHELHQVRVLQDAQELHLGKPLLVPLESSSQIPIKDYKMHG